MHPLWVAELQEEIVCLCVSHIDLLLVLVQDLFLFRVSLTLDLNPRGYIASSCSVIYLSFILSTLLIVSLSGHKRIVFALDLLFCCTKFLVIRHIRPSNQTYPA
jgi:hypothetical protein